MTWNIKCKKETPPKPNNDSTIWKKIRENKEKGYAK